MLPPRQRGQLASLSRSTHNIEFFECPSCHLAYAKDFDQNKVTNFIEGSNE